MESKTIMAPEDIINSKNEEIDRLKKLIKYVQDEIQAFIDQDCFPTRREIKELVAMLEID